MSNLIIQGTEAIPTVKFYEDKGELKIEGSSLPENVLEVYEPILDWLRNYSNAPKKKTIVEFFFDYLNTASSLCNALNLEKIL